EASFDVLEFGLGQGCAVVVAHVEVVGDRRTGERVVQPMGAHHCRGQRHGVVVAGDLGVRREHDRGGEAETFGHREKRRRALYEGAAGVASRLPASMDRECPAELRAWILEADIEMLRVAGTHVEARATAPRVLAPGEL